MYISNDDLFAEIYNSLADAENKNEFVYIHLIQFIHEYPRLNQNVTTVMFYELSKCTGHVCTRGQLVLKAIFHVPKLHVFAALYPPHPYAIIRQFDQNKITA